MNRIIPLIFLLLPAFNTGQSQILVRGMFTEDYRSFDRGDTVVFSGARLDRHTNRYWYYLKDNGMQISDSRVMLLEEVDFWQLQRFYFLGLTVRNRGWQSTERGKLEEQTLDYLAWLESEKKIYNDPLAEDFLQRLIQKVHYPKFSMGKEYYLTVKIVNDDRKYVYPFVNGTILISTQLLAEMEDPNALFMLMVQAVGHVLLDSNMEEREETSMDELEQLGAIYSERRKKDVLKVARAYVEKREAEEPGSMILPAEEMVVGLSGIIGYTAWQAYYAQHYDTALYHLARLEQYGLASGSDLQLKAKCYMKIANTPESNRAALNLLLRAEGISNQYLPDIYADKGILLLRMGEYAEAHEAFLAYQQLMKTSNNREKIRWANKMIYLCERYEGEGGG